MSNKGKGRPASDWLREVTKDQNLSDIDQLEVTLMNEFRNWFRSAILQPVLDTGHYDTAAGKFVLGPPSEILSNARLASATLTSQVDTATSAGTDTLTVAAGHAYYVIAASCENSTRATTVGLTYTPNGGTATVFTTSSGTQPQNCLAPIMNGSYQGTAAGCACYNPGGGLYMKAGDVLTITQGSFVGGDDTDYYFVYYDIEV
jgi:hypothetical protein